MARTRKTAESSSTYRPRTRSTTSNTPEIGSEAVVSVPPAKRPRVDRSQPLAPNAGTAPRAQSPPPRRRIPTRSTTKLKGGLNNALSPDKARIIAEWNTRRKVSLRAVMELALTNEEGGLRDEVINKRLERGGVPPERQALLHAACASVTHLTLDAFCLTRRALAKFMLWSDSVEEPLFPNLQTVAALLEDCPHPNLWAETILLATGPKLYKVKAANAPMKKYWEAITESTRLNLMLSGLVDFPLIEKFGQLTELRVDAVDYLGSFSGDGSLTQAARSLLGMKKISNPIAFSLTANEELLSKVLRRSRPWRLPSVVTLTMVGPQALNLVLENVAAENLHHLYAEEVEVLERTSLVDLESRMPVLESLDINATQVGQATLQELLKSTPALQYLLLQNCVDLTTASVDAAAEYLGGLRVIDFGVSPNDTAVVHTELSLPEALIVISSAAPYLEALVLGGIVKTSTPELQQFADELEDLPKLQRLNLSLECRESSEEDVPMNNGDEWDVRWSDWPEFAKVLADRFGGVLDAVISIQLVSPLGSPQYSSEGPDNPETVHLVKLLGQGREDFEARTSKKKVTFRKSLSRGISC